MNLPTRQGVVRKRHETFQSFPARKKKVSGSGIWAGVWGLVRGARNSCLFTNLSLLLLLIICNLVSTPISFGTTGSGFGVTLGRYRIGVEAVAGNMPGPNFASFLGVPREHHGRMEPGWNPP